MSEANGADTAIKVLVVDDEPDVEQLVRQTFRREIKAKTHDFCFAMDGVHALEVLADRDDVSIVLTDINMPRMDGLTLLDRMADLEDAPLAVVVSAYSDLANIRSAMNKGAFDFITKPIDLADLKITVDKVHRHQAAITKLETERAKALQTQAHLSRYFSPSVIKTITSREGALPAATQWSTATFLFTDLTNFLPFVEETAPEDTVATLVAYLDEVIEIVFRHRGTVMKIVGDAVHVAFGAPEFFDTHAKDAVLCAMEIDAFARDFSARQQEKGLAFGATRIGVHSGEAIIGNFGGNRYFDFTAYGRTVNIAARLEAANKLLGTTVCVSGTTAAEVPDFRGRPVGTLELKGAADTIAVFEPCRQNDLPDAALDAYGQAYKQLQAKDPDARSSFTALLAQYPDDPLCAFHVGRILSGVVETTIRTY